MQKITKLVFATHNEGKIKELDLLLQKASLGGLDILKASELDIGEAVENGVSFEQNALIKAQYVYKHTNLPSIADDSGLCVADLDGFPGVRSAEFAEELGQGSRDFNKAMKYILTNLEQKQDLPKTRKAKFVTCLCLCGLAEEPQFFLGEIHGTIAFDILGSSGFGYDPIFRPENASLTFGQMSLEEKNSYPTHRALAMQKFLNYLKQYIR